jgi:hypothetical protein
MTAAWKCISILANDRNSFLRCYPLDERGRHLTQFKRQKRRSMAQMAMSLRAETDPPPPQPDHDPTDIQSYLNRHQTDYGSPAEANDGEDITLAIPPGEQSEAGLGLLSIEFLLRS